MPLIMREKRLLRPSREIRSSSSAKTAARLEKNKSATARIAAARFLSFLGREEGGVQGLDAGLDREVEELVADLELEPAQNRGVHVRGDGHVLAAGLLLEHVRDKRQLLGIERHRRRDDRVRLAALRLKRYMRCEQKRKKQRTSRTKTMVSATQR